MIYSIYIKGFLDKLLAFMLTVLLGPIILCLYMLLLITQGKHIFFRQQRTGKNKQSFTLYKFRTLEEVASDDLSMDKRKFTLSGNLLRKSGLDEIPQLINILKGDMSFVGPRPLPVEYETKYTTWQLARFNVKPGITGLAQVNGRNDISWGKRFELDNQYARHMSLLLDVKICLRTIGQIFFSIFKQNKEQLEMQVFNGSNLS